MFPFWLSIWRNALLIQYHLREFANIRILNFDEAKKKKIYLWLKFFVIFIVEISSDKHGLLHLSDKQAKRLKSWMRPDEFMQSPKIIDRIDSGTIKQVASCLPQVLFFSFEKIYLFMYLFVRIVWFTLCWWVVI